MSAGTLISLGADRIVMTKQATLGPIDPTLQHPLGPVISGASPDSRAGVSVEAVMGYLEAIRACEGDGELEGRALLDLSNKVHPLVLGEIFRSQQQIRSLAQRLLARHIKDDPVRTNRIIEFLCSESGSHDYTINRREATDLGLTVEKCSENLYELLRQLRNSYSSDLELQAPYDMSAIARAGRSVSYAYTRALIESVEHGAHHFVTEGRLVATELLAPSQPGGPAVKHTAIDDQRTFEGWRKVQ